MFRKKIFVLGLASCLTVGGAADAFAEQLNIDMDIPVIEGLQDKEYQEQLNDLIKSQVLKEKENMEKELAEYLAAADEGDWEPHPFELKIDYSIKNKANILSFTISTYTYTGGANGMQKTEYYNIDLKENKNIILSDLFPEESNYQEKINAEIKKQIEEQVATGEKDFFGTEDSKLEGFNSITENQAYYLEDGKLIIAFAKYEIAPGAMGEPTFEIPLVDLQEVLKEEYQTLLDASVQKQEQFSLEQSRTYVDEAGITMIPLRYVAENLGYRLEWDSQERSVELSQGAQWTKVREGEDSYFFARMAPFSLGAAPVISAEGMMYVPLEFVTRVLQAEVTTEDGEMKISIVG